MSQISPPQDISIDELVIDSDLLTTELASIDVLNEFFRANGWATTYRQVNPGPLRLQMAGRLIGNISLFSHFYDQRIVTVSHSPEEVVSAYLGLSNEEVRISGHVGNLDTIVIAPPGTTMTVAAPSGASGVLIDIPTMMFREFLQAVTGRDSIEPAAQFASFRPDRRTLAPLHWSLRSCLSGADYRQSEHGDDARIVTPLCELLHGPVSKPIGGNPYRRLSRDRTIRRAKDYIHVHLDHDIRAPKLSQYCGVSLSTLERLFKREIGVTPNQYMLAARLHEAHRMLRNSDALHLSVADVAIRAGFRHMGRFSQQYRRHFGVLPSEDRPTAWPVVDGAPGIVSRPG